MGASTTLDMPVAAQGVESSSETINQESIVSLVTTGDRW